VLKRKIQLAVGLAILVSLALGTASYRCIVKSSESDRWVRHTREVLENLQNVVSGMESIEASERGFVLTGEESYIESYGAGILGAEQNEAAVRNLTADNPRQQRQLPALEELMARKIQSDDMVISLRRAKGLEAAADAVRVGPSQRIMADFLGVVRKIHDEELRLLLLRDADAKRRLAQTETALLFGTVLGVLIAAGAGWTVRHDIIARDLAEDALREGEERFRTLANNISQLAWMADEKGSIFWYNQRWFDYSGTTLEEMAGWGWQKVHHPDHVQRVVDKISRCFQTGEVWEDTFPLRGRDGNYRWFLSRAVPIHDSEGRVLRWFGTNTDVTVHKEAEEYLAQMEESRRRGEDALRESEERYRMILDGVQNYAIFMMDPRGQIVSWNAGAERIKGYSAEQIIGHNFSCFFPPAEIERGRPEEILRMTAASGRYEERGMRVRKDGSRFLASVMFTALRDRDGNLRGFSEFSHDLSESKESEAKYRGLLEAAPDAMVVVNQEGEIVLLNVQAEKQFGYSRDELVGQKVKNIIPEGFAERLIADGIRSAAEALAQKIGTGIELIGRQKDGTQFPIEIMLSPLQSAGGILVTAAIRNISARKTAEEHLAQTVGELKRSNEELQQFAYVSSHDLQEPLRMVASYTQLLAKRYKGRLDRDADEFIAFAVDGCNRMQGLIRDLLAYSRTGTSGKVLLEVSGEGALKQALSNLRATIEQSSAVVTHDLLPTIRTDETQLTQVFQNLVGNAIKYRSAEIPQVHVSASKNGGNEWIFSVRDNGLGIDPQYFERIFILFQRLHGRKEFEGTGIGLAICKKIVERLGGRIWVESQLEKGSTFYFGLPEIGRQ
jgi:PAS domain S-box-containing protein